MKNYKVLVNVPNDAIIDSKSVARLLKQELECLIGEDRYILDSKVYENDYRYGNDDFIRDATDKEISLYKSFKELMDYFSKLQ